MSDVLEIFEWIVYAFSGWRYLFSPAFRRRTHERWNVEGGLQKFLDILFGGLGVLLTLGVLWLLIAILTG